MKLGLALLAAVLVLAVLVVLNVRAYVATEQHELVARAERVIGRPLQVGAVTPSWWPLGIRLHDVRVDDDPSFGGGTLATVPSVVIPIGLWGLATGAVEAAGLHLEAPRLRLVRDERGRWNVATLGRTSTRAARAADGHDGGRRLAFELPVEWLVGVARARVDGGTIDVEDRTGASPRRLTLEELRVRAHDLRFGADARLVIDAVLRAPGNLGRAHVDVRVPHAGESEAAHTPFEATLVLRDLEIAPLALLAGVTATGRVDEIDADVHGTSTSFESAIRARTSGESARSGERPLLPALPLTLEARAVAARGRIALEEGRLTIGDLALMLTGSAALDPWQAALNVRSVEGSDLALPIGTPPLEARQIRGDAVLGGAQAKVTVTLDLDAIPVEIAATITGVAPWTGEGRVDAAPFGGAVRAEVSLSPSALSVRLTVKDVDIGDALARVDPAYGDDIDGTASGAATVAGPLAGGTLVAGAVSGAGELTLTDGRLRGINIADQVLTPMTGVPLLPRLLSARTRARYEHVFGTDDTVLTRARVPFTIAERRLLVEDGRLESENFEIVGGSGWLNADRELRFQGDLVLSTPLSLSLVEEVRPIGLLRGPDGRVVVPFRVRGPLTHARPEVDAKRLRSRGLTALFTRGADGGVPPRPLTGGDADDARRDEPAADRVDGPRGKRDRRDLDDRVEEMLRP